MLRNMKPKAIIEVGSNSLKLLIAEKTSNGFMPVHEEVIITRLSRGMKNHRIQNAPLQKTLGVLKDFLSTCENPHSIKSGLGSVSVQAFATAALREAKNRKAIIEKIRRQTGLKIRVLSEKEEALCTSLGALSDLPQDKKTRYVVVDIGGKSTEFAAPPDVFLSIPIGAVSLYERFIRHDPPLKEEIRSMRNYISNVCKNATCCVSAHGKNNRRFSVVGVGGTFTTLASLKRQQIHHYKMPAKELKRLFDKLCGMTVRERIEKTGIEKGRADIIVPGAAIALEILDMLGAKSVLISTRGVRYGCLGI
ncbi:MAG: hypothetical protein HZA48_02935 [Planctomycetes bacterium]|nr:hypothetical protein [Planctomycetota bacterium]